jgi:hypothetical protein
VLYIIGIQSFLFSLFFSILSILLPSLNDFVFLCTFVDFLSCLPSSLVCSQVQAIQNHALCSVVNVKLLSTC